MSSPTLFKITRGRQTKDTPLFLDFDGVLALDNWLSKKVLSLALLKQITPERFAKINAWRTFLQEVNKNLCGQLGVVNSQKPTPFFILTSRLPEDRQATFKFLARYDLFPENVIFRPSLSLSEVNFKIGILMPLPSFQFYENNPLVAQKLLETVHEVKCEPYL